MNTNPRIVLRQDEQAKVQKKGLKTRWLWFLLFVSFTLDQWHCTHLTEVYNCQMQELLFKADFYILSPIFGLVDLLLGVAIMKRAARKKNKEYEKMASCVEVADDSYLLKKEIKIITSVTEKWIAIGIVCISILSLFADFIKLIF